jgi:hypothetical protein
MGAQLGFYCDRFDMIDVWRKEVVLNEESTRLVALRWIKQSPEQRERISVLT